MSATSNTEVTEPPEKRDMGDDSSSEDEGVFMSKLPATDTTQHTTPSPLVESQTSQISKDMDSLNSEQLSRDEEKVNSEPEMIIDDSDDDINRSLSLSRRKLVMLDSDDDDDIGTLTRTVKKFSEDSDSEEEDEDRVSRKPKKRIVHRIDSDSDDDSDIVKNSNLSLQSSPGKPKPAFKYSSDIFDAEMSDEDRPGMGENASSFPARMDNSDEDIGKEGNSQKKPKKLGKIAQRKQQEAEKMAVHSETQRMIRESSISLPYHRPKQRTLAEFLNRRKKTVLPERSKGSSLKMSMKNLEALRLLEEKKKEVETFFKSDSEDEDPDDHEWKPEDEKNDTAGDISGLLTENIEKDETKTETENEAMETCETKNSEKSEEVHEVEDEKNKGISTTSKPVSKNSGLSNVTSEMISESNFELPEIDEPGNTAKLSSDDVESENVHKNNDSGLNNSEKLKNVQEINDSGVHSGGSSPMESQAEETLLEKINKCDNLGGNESVRRLDEVSCELEEQRCKDPEKVTQTISDTKARKGTTFDSELPDLSIMDSEDTVKHISETVEKSDNTINMEITDTSSLKFIQTKKSDDPELVSSKSNMETDEMSGLDVSKTITPKSGNPRLSLLASRCPGLDLSKLITTTPKLSGGGDDIIDLEEESTPTNNSGMIALMDRFVKHSNTKRKPAKKQQVNLNIVSKEKDAQGAEKLVSSDLVVTVDSEEDEPTECAPGARLVTLKTALKARIREQREEQRLRRVKEKQFLESEEIIKDFQDDCPLPDEEAELTDGSDTEFETESEPEENDVIITEKKRKKNKFLNDEAEEDEVEDDADNGDADNDDGDEDENEGDEDEDDDAEPNNDDDDDASNDIAEVSRVRVIQDDDDDDDDEDNEDNDGEKQPLRLHLDETQDINGMAKDRLTILRRNSTEDLFASQPVRKGSEVVDRDTSMDSSFELYGSVIPGHQPGGGTRRAAAKRSDSENDSSFLTPFIKSRSNSFGKDRDLTLPIEDSQDLFCPATAPAPSSPSNNISLHLTPLKDSQFPDDDLGNDSGAKLRLDFSGIDTSQDKDELIGLCSGQFTDKVPSTQMHDLCEDSLAPTQDIGDLVGLCSGQFSEKKDTEANNPADLSSLVTSQAKDDGDSYIEDDLLGLCTGKFTSQAVDSESTSTSRVNAEESDVESTRSKNSEEQGNEMVIYSSDDEAAAKKQHRMKRRNKRRRIVELSDDEDAQDAIEFDEDENEIPRISFSGFKDKKKGGIRADFLENEAELSGSDYNSADEDERDDDEMEQEEGDAELYDENELRDQVGRAHLKTVLDSDKREIRLLQEMYLEDGEMHGEGRQRQFRWKNLNNPMDDDRRNLSDDEGEVEEDPEDAEWRKQRFEREKFLKEQKAKEGEVETDQLNIKLRTVVRSNSLTGKSPVIREPLKTANPVPAAQPIKTKPIPILSKRGSFLKRDKQTLARIAELTRDMEGVVGGAKRSGNFVFKQLSAEEAEKQSTSLKRTHSQSIPSAKKPKLDRSFFSMNESQQSSSIFKYF